MSDPFLTDLFAAFAEKDAPKPPKTPAEECAAEVVDAVRWAETDGEVLEKVLPIIQRYVRGGE
jgi:hypothetical protein